MSGVKCQASFFLLFKVVKLAGGGSVINGATSSSFHLGKCYFSYCGCLRCWLVGSGGLPEGIKGGREPGGTVTLKRHSENQF